MVYSAYAEAKFPIKCTEVKYCTPPNIYDEEPSKVIRDVCRADDMTIEPIQTHTFHVSKEQAIQDFKPHGYNCSSRSLGLPSAPVWEISRFSFNRTWVTGDTAAKDPSGFQDGAEFYYKNTATDSDWPMNMGPPRPCSNQGNPGEILFDGTQQLACLNIPVSSPTFQFDNITSTLTLNQAWSCDGIDGDHT